MRPAIKKVKNFMLMVFACAWLAYSSCLNSAENQNVQSPLRLGVYVNSLPDFSLAEIHTTTKLLVEELGQEMGIETQVSVYDDIQTLRSDFESGRVNFVGASSLIVAKEFDPKLLADGFRFVKISDTPDQILILAQRKYGNVTLKDLRGKRLVLAETDPVAELAIDYFSHVAFNQGYKTSFIQIPRERKTHQLLLKLFFDQADVTCVYQNAYQIAMELNPQLQEKLQIVAHLEGIPQGTGFFHTETDPVFREQVIGQVSQFHSTPRGQQLLEIFKADKAVRTTVADLLTVKKLYRDLQLWGGRK